MEEKYPCPKMTPIQWVENFWYNYKWFVVLFLVVATFIGIATVQYFTKSEPDVSVLYVGSKNLSDADCKRIIASTESRISDWNEDGKIKVNLKNFVLLSDYGLLTQGQKTQVREEYQEYSEEILSGDGAILLLDDYFFRELSQDGALVNLYEVYDVLPPAAVSDFGLRLGDTSLYREGGYASLPKDTVMCLKFSPVISGETAEERARMDQINREIFRELVQETAPEDTLP